MAEGLEEGPSATWLLGKALRGRKNGPGQRLFLCSGWCPGVRQSASGEKLVLTFLDCQIILK